MKKIISLSILALLMIGLTSCSGGSSLPKAPDFTLRDGNGKTYSLSDFKGKMVIIDFWATWCPPCKKEIPDFIDLYSKFHDKGLEILGISVDQGGWMVTNEFATSHGMNYPVMMANRDVVYQYGGISSIPTTYIIDQKGRIAAQFTGYQPREVWEAQIVKILKL